MPDQVVGVAHAGGVDRERRIGGERVVGIGVFGVHVERPVDRGVPQRGIEPQHGRAEQDARRGSPQALSGAPMALMLPCRKYSSPSGPKSIWLVTWSIAERGRLMT